MPVRRLLIRAIAMLAGLLLIGFIVSFVTNRSLLMQFLPGPRLETIVLSASHRTIDLGGGWLNSGKPTELLIRSEKFPSGWQRPEGIVVRNARIRGSVRIMGLGRNGEAPLVKESSHREGHTARTQAAAPAGILISGVEIEAVRPIPLYLGPGVTKVTVENSSFTGWSCSVGIYLDAETADNVIRNNTFSLRTGREIIAVDGSADNHIEGNRFERFPFGGIYLYRNCGEGGTVRHQTPRGNVIACNHFAGTPCSLKSYGVWLGSRNGHRSYCHLDDGYPFGSSLDNGDFADDNHLTGNRFRYPIRTIRDDGRDNRITP